MRTSIRLAMLGACVALAACSSGTVYVVHRPAPPPPPPPRLQPLEITLARPVRGQLVVQTNRPSYVALFEIVPDRGVALLAPSYAHQRTWMLARLNWVPVSWKVQSTMYYGRPSGTAVPARWVYAIASDEPLRLPDEAFHPSYMRRVLGPAAYRGTNPHVTMRAIARAFLPSVIDEAWAEDAYALAATYASDPYRTVRIYCANRTVYEVPEEMADRAWCPVHAPSGGTIVRSAPNRPDSIVAGNGQRMRHRMPETTPVRAPIDRVSEPTRPDYPPVVTDNPPRTDNVNKDVKDAKEKEKEKRNNGNAYGHTDDPNVKGRGIENEKQNQKQNDPRRQPRVETPVSSDPQHVPSDRPAEKVEVKQERQEEKQLRQEEKQEAKQIRHEEQKPDKAEHKAEKAEQKADKPAITVEPPRQAEPPMSKPEPAPVHKEETPAPQPEAKQEKQESKAEAKAEVKEEKSEAKADDKTAGKPDDKPQGKPEIRPPGAKNQKSKP